MSRTTKSKGASGGGVPAVPAMGAGPGAGDDGSATRSWLKVLFVLAAAVAVLAVVFVSSARNASSMRAVAGGAAATASGASGFRHVVGEPGPGEQAPDFTLPATDGTSFTLSEHRGSSVLLYFQEGVMCQPCWDQITDIERNWTELEQAGVDRMVTITVDPMDVLKRKAEDEQFDTAVLSDPDLQVSKAYEANKYGMMGDGYNGHSFVLVNGDGAITWRADYGGAPDYTMYLPVENLLADLEAERGDRPGELRG